MKRANLRLCSFAGSGGTDARGLARSLLRAVQVRS